MTIITHKQNLEESLVTKLRNLKYEYRPDIRDQAKLETNFREKFEALNRVNLTDREFQRLLDEIVTPDVYETARSLRNRGTFIREDSTPLNYTLVNIQDWSKNKFEIVNQLRINTDNNHHLYGVMLLINGVPVVQIQLKTLEINPRRAMEQIVQHKNNPENGYTKTLLSFIQLFIISNRTDTWYFTNNNARHFTFGTNEEFLPIYQFADEDNIKITDLDDFADRFLAKCSLGQMISKYMVLIASEQKLLIMRPYQIYAVKTIVECIDHNNGNGYIWHTNGSGKTVTSFKTATLLKTNPNIHKCLFVVDRKDLDHQTRKEFNRFQERCVEENTNTEALIRRLESDEDADKVIVTTIQKLGLALDENNKQNCAQGRSTFKQRLGKIRNKRMAFIFDECQHPQFGETHKTIKEFFEKSQRFGFTGAPIFEDNTSDKQIEGDGATERTTKDLFHKVLHTYSITQAIKDRNVLRFHIDYYKPKHASILNPGETLAKWEIAQAILDKHDAATANRRFNALLATASINDAIEYYKIFKQLQAQCRANDPEFVPLKIAAVFSPPAEDNKDIQQIQEGLPQEKEDNQYDPEGKKTALKAIIADYNQQYGTNHDINNFDRYCQDIQQRMTEQHFPNHDLPDKGTEKIDINIVVDMLLTGFDTKYLNTLYIDKNLKLHSLIQAFSRTNRVLNATKPYGHIVDFRQQHDSVNTAITRFSGAQTDRTREIWLVDKAPVAIDNFEQAVANLAEFMQSQNLEAKPNQVTNLMGDDADTQFIKHFKEVQHIQTELDQYTDLTDEQHEQIEQILPKDDIRAFRGVYLDTAQHLKEQHSTPGKNGQTANPEVDHLDFEFILFASALIDFDYIIKLITKYSGQDPKNLTISCEQIIELIQSDAKFLDDREEITEYIRSLTMSEGLEEATIRAGYKQFKAKKQTREIDSVAHAHGLKTESLAAFVDTILQRMIFDGEQIIDLMEPLGLNWRERREHELALMADLVPVLNKGAHGQKISGLNAYEQVGTHDLSQGKPQ